MKKKLYILAVLSIAAISCNKDMLEFNPTDSGSGEELMKDASTAISSINGIYRSMWTARLVNHRQRPPMLRHLRL